MKYGIMGITEGGTFSLQKKREASGYSSSRGVCIKSIASVVVALQKERK